MLASFPLELLSITFLAIFAQAGQIRHTRASNDIPIFRCGNEYENPHDFDESEARFKVQAVLGKSASTGPRIVPTYFHVITDGARGELSDDVIFKQMDVINDKFNGTGFTFPLQNITRTDNPAWFYGVTSDPTNPASIEMKQSLRVGGADALNLYTVSFNASKILGFATFPDDYDVPGRENLDGVVVLFNTLPGVADHQYNLGITAVHEIGHWLSLFHTFQGGCDDLNGDWVSDTPAEASPAAECPTGRDTCVNLPGLDPVANFMDYSNDGCLSHFTPGQIERMQSKFDVLRFNSTSSNTTSPFGAPGLLSKVNDSGPTLQTPAIVGIVIGGVAALILLAGGTFLLVRRSSQSSKYRPVAYPAPARYNYQDRPVNGPVHGRY